MSPAKQTSGRTLTASTEAAPADRRLEYWQDIIARVHLRLEITPRPNIDFKASLFAVSLDDANLLQVTSSAHNGRRRGRATDDRGHERGMFVAVQRGQLVLSQEGRECRLMPGEMAFIDSRLAFEYAVPEQTVLLGIGFPRDEMTRRIGAPERVAATALSDQVPIYRLAYSYLERLFTYAPEIDLPELFRLKNHALDLIAIVMGRVLELEASGSSYKAALRDRVRGFIEQRLHDPTLNIESVAEAFRVTPRYVSQLFSEDGVSFSGFVRQRRLDRCRSLLELSRASAPSIGEIATTVGFGSQAYLSKVFRKEFGMAPGDYRRSFQRRTGEA